jgi:pyruvate,water dikinase
MAVIIQKMIKPSKAGVLFTADPVTGTKDSLMIEAVIGPGEKLVDGSTDPDRYLVNRKSSEIHTETANGKPNLTDSEVSLLIRDALLAEEHWGDYLDMEWVIDRGGRLFWLQARPVTTLDTVSLDTPIDDDNLVTRANIGEMFPGAATPLTQSVFGECLDWGLHEMYIRSGVFRKGTPSPRYIYNFDGQFFMSLSHMYIMVRRVAGASREQVDLNIVGRTLEHPDPEQKASGLVRLINGIRYARLLVFSHRRYLRKISRLALRPLPDFSSMDDSRLYYYLQELQDSYLNPVFLCHYVVSGYSGVMNAVLAAILSGGKDITHEAQSRMAELLTDIPDIESAKVIQGLEVLAGMIAGSERAEELLAGSAGDLLSFLNGPDSGETGRFYRAFFRRHAHRCIREAELREEEWGIRPEILTGNILELARLKTKNGKPVDVNTAPGGGETVKGEKLPPGTRYFIKKAKQGVRERELSKSRFILAQYRFKLGYRELAGRMTAKGLLPDEDLIFFLTRQELEKLLVHRDFSFWKKARMRRKLFPAQMELSFPEISLGRPEPAVEAEPPGGKIITGNPVSRGITEGRVRIVKKADDAEKLQAGEIMVAVLTDIGWSPYYGKISGLITELGGALSHGAVVAREYGLPLVSNIAGATRILKTGQKIRMDGVKGKIWLLDENH